MAKASKRYIEDYLPSPEEANAESDQIMAQANADAMNNGLAMGIEILGQLGSQLGSMSGGASTAKYGKEEGGNLNVENKEMIDDPLQGVQEVKGKTHRSGGEDVNVSEEAVVFSNKIKDERQRSLAEKKKKREAIRKKMAKMLKEDSLDKAKRNAYERKLEQLRQEEQKDLMAQREANVLAQLLGLSEDEEGGEEQEKAKYGKNKAELGKDGLSYLQNDIFQETGKAYDAVTNKAYNTEKLNVDIENMGGELAPEMNYDDGGSSSPSGLSGMISGLFNSEGGSLKAGDLTKLAGNIYGAVSTMSNVEDARASDRPHENYYDSVGDEAVEELEDADDDLDTLKANREQDIRRQTATNKRKARRSARGVNQVRATDSAYDLQEVMADNDLFNKVLSQRMGLDKAKANVKLDSSVKKAVGEEKARIREDKDIDNYFSNKGMAMNNIATALQQTGKDLNTMAQNPVNLELINALSQFYDVKPNGEIVKKQR